MNHLKFLGSTIVQQSQLEELLKHTHINHNYAQVIAMG